jgi:hypothetical protein
MKTKYTDIFELAKLSGRADGAIPKWYDENGVPRWHDFDPSMLANIYAERCALIEIACQNCQHIFHVAISDDDVMDNEFIFEYGDPPNIDCCDAGPAMGSVPIKILEYYERNSSTKHKWVKKQEAENASIYPDWMDEDLESWMSGNSEEGE